MSIKFDRCLGVHLYFMSRQKKSNSKGLFQCCSKSFSIEFILRKNGTVSETWQLKDEDLPEKAWKAMKAVKAMKAQPMKSVKKKPSKK